MVFGLKSKYAGAIYAIHRRIYLITIVFGIVNLISSIQRVLHYRSVALIHGLLAATGLLLVFIHIVAVGYTSFLLITFAVLSLATLGGVTMLIYRLKHKRPPAILLGLHPFVAITGFILLTAYILP